jgi:hypothetical protein
VALLELACDGWAWDPPEGSPAALAASGTGTFRWDVRTGALESDEELGRLFGLPPSDTVRSLDRFLELAMTPNQSPLVVSPKGDPPVAVDDAYSVPYGATLSAEAPGVLWNDSDPSGDVLSAALVTPPAEGSLTLNPDGSFSYTPPARASEGTYTFTYQAVAGGVASNVATVSITVLAN